MAGTDVLASAATAASYNMLLQLLFRLLTFVLNAFVLRFISSELLGVVNVRLTLLYSTILFVSREAFRRACLSKSNHEKWPQLINLLWWTLPIGILSAVVFGYIWAYWLDKPDAAAIPYYEISVWCYALSAVIEMVSEPLWIVGQILLFVRLKVVIEGFSIAVRCILTVIFVLYFPQMGIIGFCIAQIVFTSVFTLLYYVYFTYYISSKNGSSDFPFKSIKDFLPNIYSGKISWDLASLTWSFFKQSYLKQLLTEGERYVMTVFDVLSFGDQGVYDVINNLGSLAARFIFLPIEDSAYLFFSQTLTRGRSAKDHEEDSLELPTQVLESLLRIVTLIGCTILVFGYSFSHLLLDLYGGSLLSSGTGPVLLRWYCSYVLLLAINGITECFAFATMSKTQVDTYNHKMLLFSVVFLTSSWYFTRQLGSVGFILANCLNMVVRILHSMYHIHKYYLHTVKRPLYGLLPSIPVLIAFLTAFVITSISEVSLCCNYGPWNRLAHVGVGCLCIFLLGGTVLVKEKDLINFTLLLYKQRKQKQA